MASPSSSFSSDVGKYVADKLVSLAEQTYKLPQFCEKVALPKGMAATANFITYGRTDIPQAALSEGVTPTETPFSASTQAIVADQWGMFFCITDVAEFTIMHPLMQQGLQLLGDAIARVQEFGITDVLMNSSNKQFWDGSRADRAAITSTDVFKKEVLGKALVNMRNGGAGERDGEFFICVIPVNLEVDILNETNAGAFSGYSLLQSHSGKVEKVEKGLVGAWLGHKFIRSNYMPAFTRLTFSGTVTATTGGSLSGTVYYKIVRRSTKRGFGENFTVEANVVMSANTRLQFVMPSTTDKSYDIYAGSSTGDAAMFLAVQGLAASAVYNLDTVPTSGTTAPTTPAASVTVYPMYIFGKEAMNWVELTSLAIKGAVTPRTASDSDPLSQRIKVGSKYMAKSGVRRSFAVLIVEMASNFN